MSTATIKYGPFTIHWYGIIVAVAIIAGLAVAIVAARYRGQRVEPLAGMLLLGALSGLIGARAWYYLFRRDWYSPDPGRVFAVWQGGLALDGAIVGGVLAVLIYTWKHNLSFWEWADICALGMILGQAIGRVGDLLNNQAFGPPTGGPFAVVIPPENRPQQYLGFSHFTPTAAYEGVWDLVVFAVLVLLTVLQRRQLRQLPIGAIFLSYLMLYSIGRIPLETQRLDSLMAGDMRVAQLAGAVMIVVAIVLYAIRLLPRREAAPVVAPVAHGVASDAYLAAATRGSLSRLMPNAQLWDDLDYGAETVVLALNSGSTEQAPTASEAEEEAI